MVLALARMVPVLAWMVLALARMVLALAWMVPTLAQLIPLAERPCWTRRRTIRRARMP